MIHSQSTFSFVQLKKLTIILNCARKITFSKLNVVLRRTAMVVIFEVFQLTRIALIHLSHLMFNTMNLKLEGKIQGVSMMMKV